MEIIKTKKTLVRSLLDGGRICQLRLVDLTGPVLSVSPFEAETAATVFIDARVVLIDREALARVCCGDEPQPGSDAGLLETLMTELRGDIIGAATGEAVSPRLSAILAKPGETPSASVLPVAF